MKIALTIPTGRPRVKQVVKAFIENAIHHGHNIKDFSIYLAIDTKYQDTNEADFRLDKETEKNVFKTTYISEEDRLKIAEEVIMKFKVTPSIAEQLFMGNGYSKQRNAALLLAIKDGNDFAICIDDDEAPFIPIKNSEGKITWENLDFFGPHIKELKKGTDITRGPYMGYQSPIPSDFEKDVPEEIREKLGDALQLGNDVITRYSFFNLLNQIKYLSEEELKNPSRPFEVKSDINGKHIYAGNMGINLNSVRKGKVPIFFTPPNARGEDTIFALQLMNVVVKEVPSYIFHDPFNIYSSIFEGNFPEFLKAIPVTEDTKLRFANALIGWLKYAPMLITMTSKSEEEKNKKIEEMLAKISDPTKKLALIFHCEAFNECFGILKDYSKNVDHHYDDLISSQVEWRNKIIPQIK